jgi:hypothetical protein
MELNTERKAEELLPLEREGGFRSVAKEDGRVD